MNCCTCRILLVSFLIASCVTLSTAAQQVHEVELRNFPFVFAPANITIEQGDTVRWVNREGDHTVTNGTGGAAPNAGSIFDVRMFSGNPMFEKTFTAVEFPEQVFDYFCRPHEFVGMSGTITIVAPVTEPILTLSATAIEFGELAIGMSTDRSFMVTNTGVGTLDGVATAEPPFEIVSGGTYALNASQSQAVQVRFTPTMLGPVAGVISLTGAGGGALPVSGVGSLDGGAACMFSIIEAASPIDGSVMILEAGVAFVDLPLVANTFCDVEVERVEFDLDGQLVGEVLSPPFTLTAPGVGLGAHTLVTRGFGHPMGNGMQDVITTTTSFMVASAAASADSDDNGLPDDPFGALAAPGDTWHSTSVSGDTSNTTVIAATMWTGPTMGSDTLPVSLSVNSATAPGVSATATALQSLLNAGELGILVLEIAPDLATLYGAGPMVDAAVADLPGTLIVGAEYVEASILVSADGGTTFQELDTGRLDQSPLHIVFTGLNPGSGPTPTAYTYDSVAMNGLSGLSIDLASTAAWLRDSIVAESIGTTSLDLDLSSLSAVAVFGGQGGGIPVIGLSAASLDLGNVVVNATGTRSMTVSNDGESLLEGNASVTLGSGEYSIVSGGTYSLGMGESQTVEISFAPTMTGSFAGALTFTGGGGATLSLTGTGISAPTPTGCGALMPGGPVSPFMRLGDVVLVCLASVLLIMVGRARAERRASTSKN